MRNRPVLIVEAASGAAGDMFLGALLDLGLDVGELVRRLESLGVTGWRLETERVSRAGLPALKVHVRLDVLHGGEEAPGDSHAHHGHQGHESGHGHQHLMDAHGPARSLADILQIIRASGMSERAKSLADKAFQRLGEAEATAHVVPVSEVHFHEVGALDALIDICGTAILVDMLDVEAIFLADLAVGGGTVHCAHGELEVPTPATRAMLSSLPFRMGPRPRELLTPTGAALLRALEVVPACPSGEVLREGFGAGSLDFTEHANRLRLVLAHVRSAR